MSKVGVELAAQDKASRDLKTVAERLRELRTEMDRLKGKQDLTVADARNLQRVTREANALENALKSASGTGVQSANALKGAFGGLGDLIGGLGLGGLAGALSIAGIGAAAVGAGKLAVELGRMGEESEILQARSAALSGGLNVVTANVQAMDAAVGSALTRDEMMADATQMLTSGVATTGQAMADLAEMAIRLGPAEENAQAKVESFSRALQTGRATSLIPYGFDLAELTKRQEELQRTTPGLTDKQALANAVLEQGAARVKQLTDANVPLITSQESMDVATANLKDSLASLVAQPYTVVINFVTEGIKDFDAQIQASSQDANTRVSGLMHQLADAESALAQARKNLAAGSPIPLMDTFNAQNVEYLEGLVGDLKDQLDRAKSAAAEAGDVGTAAMIRMATAVGGVSDALRRMPTVSAINWGNMPTSSVAGIEGNFGSTLAFQWQTATNKAPEAFYAAATKANTAVADDYQRQMEAAGRAAASKISGYLAEGQKFSIGLNDIRGGGGQGPNAPGMNGAFEDIYRLQAWLQDGSWADIGQQIAGGDRGKASKIIEDFQNGIFSPEVIAAIDVDKLANQAGMADLAAKSQEAFSKAIAQRAGVGQSVVDNLLGTKADAKGSRASDTAVASAMNTIAGSIETQVKGSDFAGRMIGYGETMFGYFEDGIVNKAKRSAALTAAIDAMAAAAIDRQMAANGVGSAAAAGGYRP